MAKQEEWKLVELGDLAKQVTARVDNPKQSSVKDYIGLEHLDTDELRIKRYGYADDVDSAKFICKKGDIIFARRRTYQRKLAISERDALVSTDAIILRPTKLVSKKLLLCILQSDKFWEATNALSEGSLSPRVKWHALSKTKFFVPPTNYQFTLINIMGSGQNHFERTQQLLNQLVQFKEQLLRQLYSRGIKNYKFKESALGMMPNSWTIHKLSDVCDKIRSGGTPKSSNEEYYGGTIPFVMIEDMTSCVKYLTETKKHLSEEGLNSSSAWIVPKDSVLFSIYATVGEVRINSIPVATNQAILAMIPGEKIDREFLYYYLQYIKPRLYQYFLETTQKNLTGESVKGFEIGIPPLSEQKQIVKLLVAADRQINTATIHMRNTQIMKRKILNRMLEQRSMV